MITYNDADHEEDRKATTPLSEEEEHEKYGK